MLDPGQPPPRSHARVGTASVLLLMYGTIVAAMTLSPTPLDRGYQGVIARFLSLLHRNGVPHWFGYPQLEFSANVAIFAPLGFLLGLLVSRRLAWLPLILAPAASASIELSQGLFLSQRFASTSDVVSNTIGAYIGFGMVFVLRLFMEGRDRKVIARAVWDRHRALLDTQRAVQTRREDAITQVGSRDRGERT